MVHLNSIYEHISWFTDTYIAGADTDYTYPSTPTIPPNTEYNLIYENEGNVWKPAEFLARIPVTGYWFLHLQVSSMHLGK